MPYKEEKNKARSRSWFCVFNNPEEHGFAGTPDDILQVMHDKWIAQFPQGRCALRYCISAQGLHHVHAVLESDNPVRFGAVQRLYAGMHIEPTKGNKSEATAYINKQGKYAEKGEKIIATLDEGELKGYQGKRSDIDLCVDLINQGKSPREVLRDFPSLVTKESYIKRLYYNKRDDDTPMWYDVKTYWHIGETGSGKSVSTMHGLSEKYGRDNVYCVSDYDAPFDGYNGEPVLILDEYRGSFKYQTLLELTDCLKRQVHARYCNVLKLWNEVHITSVLTPYECYEKMVAESSRGADTIQQLLRRITAYVYHKKIGDDYTQIIIPSELWRCSAFADDCIRAFAGLRPISYTSAEIQPVIDFNTRANQKGGFQELDPSEDLPF